MHRFLTDANYMMLVVAIESCLVHMIESNRVFAFLQHSKKKKQLLDLKTKRKTQTKKITVVSPQANSGSDDDTSDNSATRLASRPTMGSKSESMAALDLVDSMRDSISGFNPLDLICLVVCPIIFAYLVNRLG
jgi:hypothetical protein